ncbi:hypothetical protein [Mycolicibacterium sp. CBMA 226]|uniref:hypothetical protein n=1 Tax=Mycolicibacterium sp. CBMA 226 TaxID=2606611 RepID=UPI0012DCC9EE|nr:hypothetical protein [Mycolicibacterium sp. CBMA 226]MUL75235.1 hypothetical protein [Mycolicibacterium sp. CBMA 226]
MLINRHEEVMMYPNTYFARATVSVVTAAVVALGPLGSVWRATEFKPAPVAVALAGHSCDVAVLANTMCQGGQHRHGAPVPVGRDYRDLGARPAA